MLCQNLRPTSSYHVPPTPQQGANAAHLTTSLSSFCVTATGWPPPATQQVLSVLCTSARGLMLRVLGGGCFLLREGVQPFLPLTSILLWYKLICLKSLYLFICQNIFTQSSCTHFPDVVWVRPSWGYYTHFIDRVAKAQRQKCSW